MTLSAAQQTATEQASVRTVYFVEFQFLSGTQYLSTANQNIAWGGKEYIGLGTVGDISSVEEGEGVEAKSLTFTLNVAQPSVLALAIGAVEEYRGRSAKLYFCPLDEGFVPIGTPELCWRGIMDTMSVGMDGEQGSITLKCETSALGIKRRPTFRLNAAQHKLKNPADTGLDYLTDLIASPQLWLSKRFQAQ